MRIAAGTRATIILLAVALVAWLALLAMASEHGRAAVAAQNGEAIAS